MISISKKSFTSKLVSASLLSLTMLTPVAWSQLDHTKSSVDIVAKQLGVSMNGKFKKFDAVVNFNPSQLAQSSAHVDIDMSSFDIGAADYNKEIAKKDWFNTAAYPKASFVSHSIKQGKNGKYDVAGKLTIKGKTEDVVVIASHKQEGSNYVFDGVLPIKRNAFHIGEGDWKDTSIVADEVMIKFHIVTAAKQ